MLHSPRPKGSLRAVVWGAFFLFLGNGIAAILIMAGAFDWKAPWDESPPPPSVACTAKSSEEAQAFFTGLMPNAQVLAISPAFPRDGIGGCITKVRLLADAAQPSTEGIVFLMPDGEHFLNGPMMDATSALAVGQPAQTSNQRAVAEHPADALSQEEEALVSMLIDIRDDLAVAPSDATPSAPERQRALQELFGDLAMLPNQLVFNDEGSNTAYIVFDPSCSKCRSLFADMRAFANQYDAKMIWIPTFLADETREAAAHAAKVINEESPEKALTMLSVMMTGNGLDSETRNSLIGSLDESDYAQLDMSAAYTRALLQSEELGTPFILLKDNSNNIISYKSGYTSLEELATGLSY